MKGSKAFCLSVLIVFMTPLASFAKGTPADFEAINQALAAEGLMLDTIEWITDGQSNELGQTIHFNDRGNKQLPSDFVPADPRRGGYTDITYFTDLIDGGTSSGLTPSQTLAAIDRAMLTWDNVNCSAIPITSFGGILFDLGYFQWLLGFGGLPGWGADVTHAGWLPGAFFDALTPGGSGSIIAATFTVVFGGTDIDNNGRFDVAFRETYYNDAFPWADDGTSHIDVETVALHEAGHGLSQGHFGKAFRTNRNGKLHYAPRAVMNDAYTGIQHDIAKSDNGGHCSNWASWPNN